MNARDARPRVAKTVPVYSSKVGTCNRYSFVVYFLHEGNVLGLTVAGIAFLLLMYREHLLANKYRELIKLYRAQRATGSSAEPRWKLIYKEGRNEKELIIPAKSEPEALQAAVRDHRIRYDLIKSLTQI